MRMARQNPTESAKPSKVTPKRVVIGGAAVIACAVVGVYFFWPHASVLDASTVRQVKFPVYAPKSSPEGFVLQKNSTVVTDSTITYSFANDQNDIITVTVQPRPSSLDMRQMTEGGSVKSTVLASGTLYDLSAGGASKYLLDMGDSLVFITSARSINTSTINALAIDLQRVN